MWLYEIRRCGRAVLTTPVAAAAAVGLAATLLSTAPAIDSAAAATVPLAAGLTTAAALGGEQMIELLLTVQTPYLLTLARRIALVIASVGSAILLLGVLTVAAANEHAGSLLINNAALALALVGVAAYIVTTHRSTAGAATIVSTLWLAKLLVLDQVIGAKQAQAVLFLLVAFSALWLTGLRAMDSEAQLRGATG
ncbi:hypothetical protein [Nocardia sp. NPDC049149]|uniref:hypothetical protein n=1 Tax=Nocardia sp. NPDC049149 TaxID=3364315 RepID=UPI003717DB32